MTTSSEHIRLLFMEQLTGTLSESASEELAQLLATDAEVRAIWAELEEESTVLDAASFAAVLDPEAELALLHAAQTANERPAFGAFTDKQETPVSIKLRANRQWWMRAAAVFMLVAAAGLYFILRPGPKPPVTANKIYQPAKNNVMLITGGKQLTLTGDSAIAQLQSDNVQLKNGAGGLVYTDNGGNDRMNTLLVPGGMDYHITLSDGTEVWLDAGSRFHFPFSFTGGNREVHLSSGKAYFKVAGNSDHPFIVYTSHVTVQVLGTAFNLNAYTPKQTISLTEGAVIVTGYDSTKKVLLKPGQEAVLGNASEFKVQHFDEEDVLSWMKGFYYFHHTALGDIAPTLGRWFDVQVIFDQPALGNTVVTGMIARNKLPEFLQDLQTTTHIGYYFSGRELHFYLP